MQNKLYIDLLKKTLTDYHRMDHGELKPLYSNDPSWRKRLMFLVDRILRKRNFGIYESAHSTREDREEGRDWPAHADTMIGLRRLENIEYCVNKILKEDIPGDFIETGVWRGGAVIFMRALLKANDVTDRVVWAADSFEGLPHPDESHYLEDDGDIHYKMREMAISLESVKYNFEKYDLLDDQVKFLKGWFKDTLPVAPIDKLALVRLDGDMYGSTMDGLTNLYPKLSPGGYLIIDDWGAVEGCQQAVLDYRHQNRIAEEIIQIDWGGVYWRKST